MLNYLETLIASHEEETLAKNGYAKIEELGASSFKAKIIEETDNMYARNARDRAVGTFVHIQQAEKAMTGISMDCDGTVLCNQKDLRKETRLLKLLTQHNEPRGGYIAAFVDFFESSTHFYLATEFVSGPTLRQFAREARGYVDQGRLTQRQYAKVVKYVLWQLIVTVRWLHQIQHCAHLAISAETILLANARFEIADDGSVHIPLDISIKITEFGSAEMFNVANLADANHFDCDKLVDNPAPYQCPEQIIDGVFDAKAADLWAVGHVLFEALTGCELFDVDAMIAMQNELCDAEWEPSNALWALRSGEKALKVHLKMQNILRFFKRDSFSMLSQLLAFDASHRLSAERAIRHSFFSSYWKKYATSIARKDARDRSALQRQRLHSPLLMTFPFFN